MWCLVVTPSTPPDATLFSEFPDYNNRSHLWKYSPRTRNRRNSWTINAASPLHQRLINATYSCSSRGVCIYMFVNSDARPFYFQRPTSRVTRLSSAPLCFDLICPYDKVMYIQWLMVSGIRLKDSCLMLLRRMCADFGRNHPNPEYNLQSH